MPKDAKRLRASVVRIRTAVVRIRTTMTVAIRNNLNIQCIKLASHKHMYSQTRISQFVDDNQLCIPTSLPHLLSDLANYEQASWTNMKKAKTTGSLRQHFCTFKYIDLKLDTRPCKNVGTVLNISKLKN